MYIFNLLLKMRSFTKLFKIIILVICPNFLFSEIFTKSDLNFLNLDDKKFFVASCLEKEKFIGTARCLNFIGIKILLKNLDNLEITKENLKYIENKSINYLKEAAKKGNIEAYINLGWVYSNDNFESQDLIKSAEYFNLYHNLKIQNSTYKLQKEKEGQIKIELNQIISGIIIMQKLDLFKKYNTDQENYYLTEKEYIKAKKIFKEIIKISNLSILEINNLKQEILNNNKVTFNELESNLSIFEKKYRRVAIKELNKLKEILQ